MRRLKKYILILGIAMAGICLSGCSTSVISLSEEENKEVARYIADVIMQHDINYKKAELIYTEPEEEAVATPTPSPAPTEVPSAAPDVTTGDSGQENEVEGNDETIEWSELFKTEKWEIEYSSYNTYSSYPKNSDAYQITAAEGKELLVLFFNVKNLTNKKIKVNLIDNELKYKLVVGEESYDPQIAVLETGGLMFLNTKIPAGKKVKAELVFEIPKGLDLTEMRLDVSK